MIEAPSKYSEVLSKYNIELIQVNPLVTAANVEHLMRLELPDWRRKIRRGVRDYGVHNTFRGGLAPSSLEPPEFTTSYIVVKGDVLDSHKALPELFKLWEGPFCDLVSIVAGREVEPDRSERSGSKFGININTLHRGEAYETHFDYNPWTANVVVDEMKDGDGGQLVLIRNHGKPNEERFVTRVRRGYVYIFNGCDHPHKVERLNAWIRTTVPMDYGYKGIPVERPEAALGAAIFPDGNGNAAEKAA